MVLLLYEQIQHSETGAEIFEMIAATPQLHG